MELGRGGTGREAGNVDVDAIVDLGGFFEG